MMNNESESSNQGNHHHGDSKQALNVTLESDQVSSKNKGNILDKNCPCIDQRVLVPKAFYTFFYTGIGALFPYLPVYFKQLHLTPHETGVLIGVRPLIQFLATPIWGAIADRFCKGKVVLLISVLGWLVSNVLLALIPDTRHTRLCDNIVDYDPKMKQLSDSTMLMKRSLTNVSFRTQRLDSSKINNLIQNKTYLSKSKTAQSVSFTNTSNKTFVLKQRQFYNTTNSRVYNFEDQYSRPWIVNLMDDQETILHDNITSDRRIFRYLLAVTVVGTMLSAPTHAMADTATLTSLEGALHKYGKVRLWGSLGWGVGGFTVGSAVSTSYSTRCNGEIIIDYFPCFYVYAVAMGMAFLSATQFRYSGKTEDLIECPDSSGLKNAIKVLRSPQYCFLLVIAFYCGSATGFIETFLFWYLHEMGGGQFLFSVINGINCAGEVCVFLVTDRMISCFGHLNIIYLALVCYSLRFIYFYTVTSPWWVIPAELLQGITTAALWASCVSYVGLHPGASHTLQGILNGVYMGLGFAAGGFVGGGVVHLVGMRNAFLVYSVISFVICIIFYLLNKYHKN